MPRWTNNDRTPLGKIRANAGFSREQIASTLNVSLSTMIRYETGVTDIPMGIAEDMTSLYRISFDELREAIRSTKESQGAKTQGRLNKRKVTLT